MTPRPICFRKTGGASVNNRRFTSDCEQYYPFTGRSAAYYHEAPREQYHPVSSEEGLSLTPVIMAVGLFVPLILGAQDAGLNRRTKVKPPGSN